MRIGIVNKTRHDLAIDAYGQLERGPNGGTLRRRRKAQPVEVAGVIWVCASVLTGAEFRVADDLYQIGFRTFAPHMVRVMPRARLAGGRRGVRTIDLPVFAGYVFVGQPAGLRVAKRSHPQILDLVGVGGEPSRIPAGFIREACNQWCAGEWDGVRVKRAQAEKFKPGETVRIERGPFAGVLGVISGLAGASRLRLEAALFGGVAPITVDRVEVELV